MDVVIGLVIFIVGALVGVIANKFMSSSSKSERDLTQKVEENEASLAQYKQNVAEHLDSSTALLEQMNNTCQIAMEQMAKSTELLQQATPEASESMPFFSKETHEELDKTLDLRPKHYSSAEKETITEPPLDYSGNPSGLFNTSK